MGLDKVSSAKRPGSTFTHMRLEIPYQHPSDKTVISQRYNQDLRQDGKAAPGDVGQFPCAKPTVDNFNTKEIGKLLTKLRQKQSI
jgi:hypothetical protein